MPCQVATTLVLLSVCNLANWITSAQANAGLLASTLYTFQGYACEGEVLKIKCPETTNITIQFAQFGRHMPSRDMCPPRKTQLKDLLSPKRENTNCLATTSLKVLLKLCQDRRHCRVVATPETFTQDPCPETRKYLEVAYKCRPNEFKTKTACEGERLVLWCRRSMRLVIYSAMFGRTPRGSPQCPSSGGRDTDCQSGMAIEAVMKKCHGRKHCTVDADMEVFGNPCAQGTSKYLTAIYTCVPKNILKDMGHKSGGRSPGGGRKRHRSKGKAVGLDGQASYIPKPSTFHYDAAMAAATVTFSSSTVTTTKPLQVLRTQAPTTTTTTSTSSPGPISVITDQKHPSSSVSNSDSLLTELESISSPELQGVATVNCVNVTATVVSPSIVTNSRAIGFLADWITILQYLHKNRERAILYLVLGACAGLIILLLVVIIKLLIEQKRNARAKLDISEPSHPHTSMRSHIEDIHSLDHSDSTADVIEVVRFSPRGTLRSERTGPLSLHNDSTSRSLNNYYYG
ncbi:protein eva-1 homolog C-like [Liolophura sinensis]|uniref:protein eva-1 homolog C-like n=1 Tax=Liolophura sinensis TaxID=3198878 RepID=UPI003159551F